MTAEAGQAGRENPTRCPRFRCSPIDGLLVLLTLIWGGNFSVIKIALEEIPPLGFNALRMSLASMLFLGVLSVRRTPFPGRRDWAALAGLAVVGHVFYQVCFMEGLVRTSVANSSLILGCTPVAVALLTVRHRHERVTRLHWLGIILSFVGIYLLVGRGARLAGASLMGDLLMLGAVWCWAIYTVAARSLLMRQSPLGVTAWSMTIGTVLFIPLGVPDLVELDWHAVSVWAWLGLACSAIFALCVAYLIWYTAVQRIGSARTSVYSNVVPVAAMIVAAVWLGEPIGTLQVGGACAILLAVGLTRIQGRQSAPSV